MKLKPEKIKAGDSNPSCVYSLLYIHFYYMGVSAFGLYLRPRSRFSHTDRLSSVNKNIENHLLPWVPEVFFFSLEATE